MDHFGHEIFAPAPNGELQIAADHRLNLRDRSETLLGGRVIRGQRDDSFRAVPIHESLRRVDVNYSAVLDDGYAIAQPLRLLHQMSGQKNRLAALADASPQFPD